MLKLNEISINYEYAEGFNISILKSLKFMFKRKYSKDKARVDFKYLGDGLILNTFEGVIKVIDSV